MSKHRWNTIRKTLLIRPILLLDKGCPEISLIELQDEDYYPPEATVLLLHDYLIRDRHKKTINLADALRTLRIPVAQMSAATAITPAKLEALTSLRPPVLTYDELCTAEILLYYKTGRPVSPENLPFLHTRYADLLADFDQQLSSVTNKLKDLENVSFHLYTADKRRYQLKRPVAGSSPSAHPISFHIKLLDLLESVKNLHLQGQTIIDHYAHY